MCTVLLPPGDNPIAVNKYIIIIIILDTVTHIVYVFLEAATLTEVFPCFFLGCKANARV